MSKGRTVHAWPAAFLALLTVVGCSTDSNPSPVPEAGPDAFLSLTCDEWVEQLDRFLAGHQACTTSDECALVGEAKDTCECAPNYIVAVNEDYQREVQIWFDKHGRCALQQDCNECYRVPEPTCVSGRCTAGDETVCCGAPLSLTR